MVPGCNEHVGTAVDRIVGQLPQEVGGAGGCVSALAVARAFVAVDCHDHEIGMLLCCAHGLQYLGEIDRIHAERPGGILCLPEFLAEQLARGARLVAVLRLHGAACGLQCAQGGGWYLKHLGKTQPADPGPARREPGCRQRLAGGPERRGERYQRDPCARGFEILRGTCSPVGVAGAGVHDQIEVEPAAADVVAEIAGVVGLGDGGLQPAQYRDDFAAQVDEGVPGPDGIGRDDHSLDEQVRRGQHQRGVFTGAGFGLVGVDDQVVRLGGLLVDERPLRAGRETGPAAAT